MPDSFYDLFESDQPEYTVRINGVEYAWLYKLSKAEHLSLAEDAVRVDADYGNGLHLVGYKTFTANPKSGGGWILPVKIYGQVEPPCIKDYRPILRLVDDSGDVWASKKYYPPWGPTDCEQPQDAWRGDLRYPDEHWMEVEKEFPPGTYSLEAIVVHEPDELPLHPNDGDSPVNLGSIEIPS